VSRWLGSALTGQRLRVELRPGSVRVVRQVAFPRTRAVPARPIAVDPESSSREEPLQPWRATVDALGLALREQRGRLPPVELVVSDHFVRYLLIPWSEGLVGNSERLAFARLAFRDLYGQSADTWGLCLDEQPAGRASLACAVDQALSSSLHEVVVGAGGQLVALTPALADCINRHRSAMKGSEFCFVAAEPGRISLAFHSRSGWQAVRSRRIDGLLPETLPTLLKQETAVGGATGGGMLYVCADAMPGLAPFAVPGWRTVFFAEGRLAASSASDPQLVAAGS
jgi:hypothetical protein